MIGRPHSASQSQQNPKISVGLSCQQSLLGITEEHEVISDIARAGSVVSDSPRRNSLHPAAIYTGLIVPALAVGSD
jgi:hypothetical protein